MVLSRRFFAARGVLLVMKTLEDERYVVIKVYKCTVSEIWRDFFVLAYHILRVRRIPTYRVYRLCDSVYVMLPSLLATKAGVVYSLVVSV